MRALLLLALLPATAGAQELADTHFQMSFCYQAAFDAEWLEANPEEQVRRIHLGREPAGTMTKLGEVTMTVGVLPRDASQEHEAIARCRPAGDDLSCAMDGRAGEFTLEEDGEDLLLTVGSDGMLFERRSDELRLEGAEGGDLVYLVRRCG